MFIVSDSVCRENVILGRDGLCEGGRWEAGGGGRGGGVGVTFTGEFIGNVIHCKPEMLSHLRKYISANLPKHPS